jgi:hypothetical protein
MFSVVDPNTLDGLNSATGHILSRVHKIKQMQAYLFVLEINQFGHTEHRLTDSAEKVFGNSRVLT